MNLNAVAGGCGRCKACSTGGTCQTCDKSPRKCTSCSALGRFDLCVEVWDPSLGISLKRTKTTIVLWKHESSLGVMITEQGWAFFQTGTDEILFCSSTNYTYEYEYETCSESSVFPPVVCSLKKSVVSGWTWTKWSVWHWVKSHFLLDDSCGLAACCAEFWAQQTFLTERL